MMEFASPFSFWSSFFSPVLCEVEFGDWLSRTVALHGSGGTRNLFLSFCDVICLPISNKSKTNSRSNRVAKFLSTRSFCMFSLEKKMQNSELYELLRLWDFKKIDWTLKITLLWAETWTRGSSRLICSVILKFYILFKHCQICCVNVGSLMSTWIHWNFITTTFSS